MKLKLLDSLFTFNLKFISFINALTENVCYNGCYFEWFVEVYAFDNKQNWHICTYFKLK